VPSEIKFAYGHSPVQQDGYSSCLAAPLFCLAGILHAEKRIQLFWGAISSESALPESEECRQYVERNKNNMDRSMREPVELHQT
jgi:hypothetical protein